MAWKKRICETMQHIYMQHETQGDDMNINDHKYNY